MARTRVTLAFIAIVVVAGPARADESWRSVIVPMDCAVYFGMQEDGAEDWNRWLSFAACAQDASVGEIDDVAQLPGLVEDLQASLVPTLGLYMAAVKRGPGPVKLRAAFQMAMTQVALITRARSSIKAPDIWTDPSAAVRFEQLHTELEPLLEEPAFLAWILFGGIDRLVTENRSLAPDPVTRNMARMARELATELGQSWSFPRERENSPVLASPMPER
jgi:hypothetical protein